MTLNKRIVNGTSILAVSLALHTQAFAQGLPAQASEVRPMMVGSIIPDTTIYDILGAQRKVKDVLAGRPTILVVYRGGWCPYCTRQLGGLAKAMPDIEKLGVQVIGISPDAASMMNKPTEGGPLPYQLFSDSKGALIKTMGLAFQVPKHYVNTVAKASEGQNPGFLPVPAVYFIDAKGQVKFQYVNPDFKVRLEPSAVTALASSIASSTGSK